MAKKFSTSNASAFSDYYSSDKLFDKIGKVAKKAGVKTVYSALLLYYALFDGEVPLASMALVIGALGYFIFPFDFIPDIMGPLGYSDDAGAMLLALRTIWDNITPSTHAKALNRLESWFGKVSENDLKLIN